tara:strand:+ start:1208 stop:1477 length:270 start_codon:yes stop_codon:yes gene_type:complete
MILLGNLSISQIEQRAGVAFPADLKAYMQTRHQSEAANVKPGKWHCFGFPFNLTCGDIHTATEIHRHLAPLSDDFSEELHISISNTKPK